VFQVAGGLFLIYLAVMIWRHARDPLPEIEAVARGSDCHVFSRALLLQLGNPKIMVFFGSVFLSLLPESMPAWMEVVVLVVVAFDEFAWFALLALAFSGSTARGFYRRAKVWLDRIMGGVLALLGLRLALSAR
jgi:threonine/homoserine/homoserine lactone efflux protein